MQRLYSEFPAAYPGLGLLLLRLLTCGMIIRFEGACVGAMGAGNHTFADSLRCGLLIAAGVLILAGFLTPVAGLLVAVIAGLAAIFHIVSSANDDGSDWIYSLLVAGTAGALTLTGPGGFSLDARIFGPKRVVIPTGNSGREHILGSSGQQSSRGSFH